MEMTTTMTTTMQMKMKVISVNGHSMSKNPVNSANGQCRSQVLSYHPPVAQVVSRVSTKLNWKNSTHKLQS